MRLVAMFLMVLSLGLFSIGCSGNATDGTDAGTDAAAPADPAAPADAPADATATPPAGEAPK